MTWIGALATPTAYDDSTETFAQPQRLADAVGGKAKDANDRVGYNKKNGDLIYDANGDKKGGKIIFCELDAGLKVTKADFRDLLTEVY